MKNLNTQAIALTLTKAQVGTFAKHLGTNGLAFIKQKRKTTPQAELIASLSEEQKEELNAILSQRLDVEEAVLEFAEKHHISTRKARSLITRSKTEILSVEEINELGISRQMDMFDEEAEVETELNPRQKALIAKREELETVLAENTDPQRQPRKERMVYIVSEFNSQFGQSENVTEEDMANFIKVMVAKTGNKVRTIRQDVQDIGLRQFIA